MVTIINGEILDDNDPRAQEYRNRGRRQERQHERQSQQRQWTYGTHDQQNPTGQEAEEGGLFAQLNNRLLTAGFPRWNLGQYVVEPVMSVSLLLALVLFGFHGVLLVAVLWFIVQQGRRI